MAHGVWPMPAKAGRGVQAAPGRGVQAAPGWGAPTPLGLSPGVRQAARPGLSGWEPGLEDHLPPPPLSRPSFTHTHTLHDVPSSASPSPATLVPAAARLHHGLPRPSAPQSPPPWPRPGSSPSAAAPRAPQRPARPRPRPGPGRRGRCGTTPGPATPARGRYHARASEQLGRLGPPASKSRCDWLRLGREVWLAGVAPLRHRGSGGSAGKERRWRLGPEWRSPLRGTDGRTDGRGVPGADGRTDPGWEPASGRSRTDGLPRGVGR